MNFAMLMCLFNNWHDKTQMKMFRSPSIHCVCTFSRPILISISIRFGNILEGEIEACQEIAQRTGILVDPMYTLAAWEMATILSEKENKRDSKVVMLHTGALWEGLD